MSYKLCNRLAINYFKETQATFIYIGLLISILTAKIKGECTGFFKFEGVSFF